MNIRYLEMSCIAYNVDDNTDLFYKEMREGVSQILIGMCGAHAAPLVMLGGSGMESKLNYCDCCNLELFVLHQIAFVHSIKAARRSFG